MRLLHIEASPRGARSRSAMVARRLLERLEGYEMERLALFEVDLPPFGGAAIEGRYALIAGEAVEPEAVAAWARIEQMVSYLMGFDLWLISVPMWNFGIPYRLKQYIDLVTQPGLTFAVGDDGAVNGRAAGRRVVLIASGALDTAPASPLAALDHQVAYLRDWLGFIGVDDVATIRIQPTYGPDEAVATVMQAAYAEADTLAARLSRPSRV